MSMKLQIAKDFSHNLGIIFHNKNLRVFVKFFLEGITSTQEIYNKVILTYKA